MARILLQTTKSFVTDPPGSDIKRDPARLVTYMDYVANLARWPVP